MAQRLACLLVAYFVSGVGAGRSRSLRIAELHGRTNKSDALRKLYPFYHTTPEIHDELVALSSRCPGMTLESRVAEGDNGLRRSVDVVRIRAPDATPVSRNFLLFGEHSRELISPESGLHLAQTLCGETPLAAKAEAVLANSEFMLVVNANAESRLKVEQGDFCLRTNPDGVDLNRNWDEMWVANPELSREETNPGPKPFSEAETRILKALAMEYKPTNFVTVHSGTKGMYMPWAYDMHHLAKRNEPLMMDILRKLDENYCQCPFGAAGREVGYSCPGTCLDWVYDQLKTPYSFAFEIYTEPEADPMLKRRWQKALKDGGAFYQDHSHLGHDHFRDIFVEHPSSFVQLKSEHHSSAGMSDSQCFRAFNPDTEERFRDVIDNWSRAYLDLANYVATNVLNNVSTNTERKGA